METTLGSLPKRAAFLAGHEDNNFMKNSFKKGHDKAIKHGFSTQSYQCDKYYQSQSSIIQSLRNTYPVWFIYSGHGFFSSLSYGGGSSINASFFERTDIYPFVFSFACLTGNYSSPNYMATSILKQKGPVTFFASSVNTVCNSDVAIEDKILGKSLGQNSIGAMVTEGMTKYRKRFWSRLNLTRTRRYQKAYNLMGDPSLLKSGLSSPIENYVFNKPLIVRNGVDLNYECLRSIDIRNGIIIDNLSKLRLNAYESLWVTGNVKTESGTRLQGNAANITIKGGTRIEQGSSIELTARESIVLELGTTIDAGCNVLLKIQ